MDNADGTNFMSYQDFDEGIAIEGSWILTTASF